MGATRIWTLAAWRSGSRDAMRSPKALTSASWELTHHKLTAKDRADLTLGAGADKLRPMTEAGSAEVQDKEKAPLSEILLKV